MAANGGRPAYRVTAQRSVDWWVLEAIDVPGAVSRVDDLNDAEAMVREVIALVLGVDEETFDVELVVGSGSVAVVDNVATAIEWFMRVSPLCQPGDEAAFEAEVLAMSPHELRRVLDGMGALLYGALTELDARAGIDPAQFIHAMALGFAHREER